METRTSWHAPEGGGAPLLCMPNVPHPLHKLAPRTIMGDCAWNKYRKEVYAEHEDTCEVCGVVCGTKRGEPNMRQAHEVYEIDYLSRTATFVRACCLCASCHRAIHSGRQLICYQNHEPWWTKEVMLETARHAFELVHNWNKLHAEKLKMFSGIYTWLEEPSLHNELQTMINEYAIEFYTVPPTDTSEDWGKWKLIYNENEYWSPYQTNEEWAEAMGVKGGDKNNLFDGDVFTELRKNIGKE